MSRLRLPARREPRGRARRLRLFAVFHLNLFYSSIEEEQRREVIDACYWPLLKLADDTGLPFGIEAPGLTLEIAGALAPDWLAALRDRVARGRIELLGSGYTQLIGPLVPASVNQANLALGHAAYRQLLGASPRIAFVNEQAYSAGLVPLYLAQGYRALFMEWNNAAQEHPEWKPGWRFLPQRALGPGGERIALLWNDSIVFQKVQRVAHGELGAAELHRFLAAQASASPRVLSLYGNDVECFGFRPRRYATEAREDGGDWARLHRLFERLREDRRFEWIPPADGLELLDLPGAGHALRLESAAVPCPTKKQPKYNPTRWAVSGRDDLAVNTACRRIARALEAAPARDEAAWRELCVSWSSDFRTHATERRWLGALERLDALARRVGVSPPAAAPWRPLPHRSRSHLPRRSRSRDARWARRGRFLSLESDLLRVRFNCLRGLALDALAFRAVGRRPLVGTIPHGHFSDIRWSADFFSGHFTYQRPGCAQVTDLIPVEPLLGRDEGVEAVACVVETPLGPVEKRWLLDLEQACVRVEYRFGWREPSQGSLRLAHVTLLPQAFDAETLRFRTHNGGRAAETFALDRRGADHAAPVSLRISASQALGMTEGWLALGDAARSLQVELGEASAACVGMITCRRFEPHDGGAFLRLALSARELDDTSHPAPLDGVVCGATLRAGGPIELGDERAGGR